LTISVCNVFLKAMLFAISFAAMAGLYIHIPFCKQACHYCDFHFSTNQSIKAELINAIAKELIIQKNYLEGGIINTIYFGGGTPSLLSQEELKTIFNTIRENYNVNERTEVTLEANPDDLSLEKLRTMRTYGVNRLSIGIQSFDDNILQFLNRAHSKESAIRSINDARQAGFKNISIDLIYAIPGQDNHAWLRSIEQAIALTPEHISSYSLTIEDKTTFGRWSAQGKLKAIEDDIAANQLEILMDALTKAGYDQYEVSNFGKPDFYSQHNSSYWKQEKYLGIGPSAHSYNGGSRQYNVANNHLYMKAINNDDIPATKEVLTREDKINEYLLTTLRTSWGCNLHQLTKEFDYDLLSDHSTYIDSLKQKNLIVIADHHLKLTSAGKLLADKIASDLFLLKE
jgi:oxygen-independent coproporphyrinogen-3 oxidase